MISRQPPIDRRNEITYADGVFGKVEPLLDNRGQFLDTTALLSQHTLGSSGQDDDFGLVGGRTNINTGISIFSQFTTQKFVQFGLQHALLDELKVAIRMTIKMVLTHGKRMEENGRRRKRKV